MLNHPEQVCIPDKGVSSPSLTEIRMNTRRSLCKEKGEDQRFEEGHTQRNLNSSLQTELHHPQLFYPLKEQDNHWTRHGEYKTML